MVDAGEKVLIRGEIHGGGDIATALSGGIGGEDQWLITGRGENLRGDPWQPQRQEEDGQHIPASMQ